MPIFSIGGVWFVDFWNPKYAAHIFKVTVAVDMLGNIIWICPLAPGTTADALIWDGYGPARTRGDFSGLHTVMVNLGTQSGKVITRRVRAGQTLLP